MTARFTQSQLRITVSLGVALAMAAALCAVRVTAQSAGVNVPVLPVVQPGNGLTTLEAALRGDLFLNRQLEPTIAVSTRNPNHVVAFFNDYRAIDIQDFGVGQGNVARNNVFRGLLAKVFGRPARSTRKPPLPARAAAAEAWVGMARSSDGGLTWTGSFVPGSPFDSSPASMASPVKGLEAGSDPVAFAAPCGIVHVVSIFFTRGGQSKMVVTTYQDENTNEGGEAFFYKHQTVVESANNATNGHFVDKPAIAVDVLRGQSSDPCAHNVYVSYTTFNGLTSAGKIQSEVIFAKSTDNALTFTRSKLNQPFTENQGTALAVDPRPGIPNTQNGGGGTLYLAWRHFDDPDAIIVTRSTNFGQTFGKPLKITAAPMQTFDQPSIPTTTPNITPAEIAFRSNAFPTMAVGANGNVFVAWQERVDINPNSGTFGLPAAGGSPRIVLMRSTNAGKNWSGPDGTSDQQRAVDLGDRDTVLPEDGLGLLPRLRPSGPQVMPKLTFGGGRLFLSYYESLGLLGPQDTINLADVTPVNIAPPASYIAGIDRVMNVRGALLDPNTGLLLNGTATAQISRYPIRVGANLANGEQLSDIEAVNAPCSPDFGPDLPACVRKVNRVGGPHSGGGTTPFIGDYIDATPIVTFVPDGNAWRWAIGQNDVPYRAFRSIWADNRNQVPPPGNDPALYPNYSPTSNDCINPGSRNMDVFTSLVNAELVVSAPTTFTKLGAVTHAYPIFVQNMTNANRYFRFTFLLGGGIASFDQFTDADEIRNGIFAFSSFTPVVYVQPSATGTVKVSVEELTCPLDNPVTPEIEGNCTVGGLSGTATINVDPTNTATVAFESHNPLVPNPLVPNPLVPNPLVPNPLVPNPLVPNPLVPNITASNSTLQNATVYDVQYGVTTVTNEGNTTTAFTSDVKIDNPEQYEGKYVFQLVVYKESASGGFQACNTSNIPGFQILASVPMTTAMLNPLVPNPLVPNPLVPNPLVPNPLVPNPLVPNATYNVAPSDHGPTEQNSHDGTTHAPLGPDQVHVALFAYRIVPLPPPGQPDPVPPFNPQVDPPSHNVISASCNSDGTCPTSFVAPDLVVDGAPSVSPSPLAPGGSVNVSFVLRNNENYAANAEDGNFVHKLYLSTNTVLDPGDFELGIVGTSTGVLGVGATQPFMGTAPTPIPPSTPEGVRYLLLFVDADREVSEINEPNNVVAIPVTVEVPNEAPVASGSSVSTNEDTPKQITLAATDGNGNSVSFQIVTQPTHGSLGVISAVNCTGSNPSSCTASVTYTPGQELQRSGSIHLQGQGHAER